MSAAAASETSARGAFSARVVAVLIAVGVLGFAAFIVLSAFASDLRTPDEPGEHAQSRSAVGFAALVELLKSGGHPVHLHRGRPSELGNDGLLILTPPLGRKIDAELLDGIRSDALIVLPKWRFEPDPQTAGWVRQAGAAPPFVVGSALAEVEAGVQVNQMGSIDSLQLVSELSGDSPFDNLPPVRIDRLQTMDLPEGMRPMLSDGRGHVVLGRIVLPGRGKSLYILSEPDLLNTYGVADSARAQAGLAIIWEVIGQRPGLPITFDMTLHGVERSRNLMKLLLEPPFLPATLCLLFAAILVGLHAAIVRRMPRPQRRGVGAGAVALVENSALLVTQAGKDLAMGQRYAAMTRALTTPHVGGAPGLSERQQADLLDAVARARGRDTFRDLAAAIAAARKPADLMDAVRRLYNWRQELARDRRRG